MVLDEADNMWLKPYQESVQTKSYGLSRALVEAMVWNQEDHPSVIMWSMENESSAKNPTVYTKWLSDMRDAAKALDPEQRPVTWAWPARHPGDPSTDLPDVIGLNEYFGWRYGTDSDLGAMLDALHARHPTKPILITENGTSAWAGTGPASKPGTQEWRVREFRRQWGQVVARTSYMAGYTYWLLKDYKERMVYNRGLNGISTMGLMTFGERPRPIYFAFKDAPIPQV
jgi:beta-glucuronidase